MYLKLGCFIYFRFLEMIGIRTLLRKNSMISHTSFKLNIGRMMYNKVNKWRSYLNILRAKEFRSNWTLSLNWEIKYVVIHKTKISKVKSCQYLLSALIFFLFFKLLLYIKIKHLIWFQVLLLRWVINIKEKKHKFVTKSEIKKIYWQYLPPQIPIFNWPRSKFST